ncbi:MAG: cohesin domain-containing protein, partial [Bacteroidota bacterium]
NFLDDPPCNTSVNNLGNYACTNVPFTSVNNNDILIKLSSDNSEETFLNGTNISDVVATVGIVLGDVDGLDNYDLVAADINRDEQVTVTDVQKIISIIVGDAIDFPSQSFRYLTTPDQVAFEFASPASAYNYIRDSILIYNNLTPAAVQDSTIWDLVAIKLGDVLTSNDLLRSAGSGGTVANISLQAGEERTLCMTANGFTDIEGFQLSLEADDAFLEIVDVTAGDLPYFDSDNYNLTTGREPSLKVLWADFTIENAQTLSSSAPLFNVQVRAKRNIRDLSQVLWFSDLLPSKFVDSDIVRANVQVSLSDCNGGRRRARLSLSPNPISKATDRLQIESDQEGPAQVSVYTTDGRLLTQFRQTLLAGVQSFDELAIRQWPSGLLLVKVELAEHTYWQKVLKIE